MATQTETNIVEIANNIQDNVLELVRPLIDGSIVNLPENRKNLVSSTIRNYVEIANKIRTAHDEWVKMENEAGNEKLETIRKQKGKTDNKSGFLKL